MKRFIFWAVFFSVCWWSLYTLAQTRAEMLGHYYMIKNSQVAHVLNGK